MRIDQYLVSQNFFESRTKAQAAIEEGLVFLNGVQVLRASETIVLDPPPTIQVQKGNVQKFVSRGGLKLEGALQYLNISVQGKNILDVGVSTGGFSDCLLSQGAQRVVGIDVGQNQVHPHMKNNPQFFYFEKLHIKDLTPELLEQGQHPKAFDFIVCDVSFISLKKVVPFFKSFLAPQGRILCLVKPQFELDPKLLGKKGIVKDLSAYKPLEEEIKSFLQDQGYRVLDYFESPIQGGDGNHEFFVFAQISE